MITVTGSTSPRPLEFSGTYEYLDDDRRVTRDLSGSGSFAASFFADELVYVRVSAADADGLYSLRITENGELLFDSAAQETSRPIIFSAQTGP